MRLKLERPLTEKDYGRRRVISKFLWFPREIDYEIRWLEKVLIEQVVDFDIARDKDCHSMTFRKHYWRDSKWVNVPSHLL